MFPNSIVTGRSGGAAGGAKLTLLDTQKRREANAHVHMGCIAEEKITSEPRLTEQVAFIAKFQTVRLWINGR
jgi:hypothetical protein